MTDAPISADSALHSSVTPRPGIEPANALEFMRFAGLLKTLKRTGWINHGVNLPESDADHMYRMAILAMLITDSRVNKDKLVKSELRFLVLFSTSP